MFPPIYLLTLCIPYNQMSPENTHKPTRIYDVNTLHALLLLYSGIQPLGCYLITRRSRSLSFLEGTTTDLSDSPLYREQPIRKCGEAAQSSRFSVFAVSLGYCISGSNRIQDYQHFPSALCQGGVGGIYV